VALLRTFRRQRSAVLPAGRFFTAGGRDPRSGAAFLLILVLAALLSAGVVAFFFFSNRHLAVGTSPEAASMALLARSQIIGNFRAEMAAGSASPWDFAKREFVPVEGPAGTLNLLFPATPRAAVPARSGRLAPPNLIKWSTRDAPFYGERAPGTLPVTYPSSSRFPPAAPASPVSTLDRSANGKVVALKRWNATWLLPKRTPSSTDPTPVGLPIPDWVCLTARGEQRNSLRTQGTDPIVGRYAYLVFDEGGLLDASVAGFDSRLDPSVVAAKASPRSADLRPLLEAGGLTAAEATACNNAFVKWRDPAFLTQSAAAAYSNALSGLGPAVPGALFPGNRTLVSRQALIRLMHERLPGNLSARQNALQYLGTFSRSLAQPHLFQSWAGGTPPILPSGKGGNDGAGWNERHANPVQHINPPFALVRVKASFERADGTPALPGEPLVKKRFSLTRLDLLKKEAVAAVGSPIEKLFGFSRAKPDEPWLYRDGKRRILTLDEVANLEESAAREPDFVELLKASILAGALAKNSGIPLLPPDDSLDEAVIQIAANIIDQADADAFPTRVKLDADKDARVFSGIENLPYLAGVSTRVGVVREALPVSLLRSPDGTSPVPYYSRTRVTNPGETVLWQAFQFWNPHELSGLLLRQARPKEFRLSVQATNRFGVRLVQKRPMPVHSGTMVSGASPEPDTGPEITGEQLRFDLPLQALAAFYQPEWVLSEATPLGINARLGEKNLLPPMGLPDVKEKPIFGVGLARGSQVFSSGTPPNEYAVLPSLFLPEPAPHLFYRLEYNLHAEGESPLWIAYDEKLAGPLAGIDAEGTAFLECWPDPRTRRFGAFGSAQDHTELQVRERFFQNTGDFPGDYADPDGVRRRGAGASCHALSPLETGARPPRLDRPFRSVGELASVFAGTPWRYLDFATPESGFAGLLEAFCVGENSSPDALEIGRVSLNTRQVPVLQAVLAGADLGTGDSGVQPLPAKGAFSARSLAEGLVARTSSTRPGEGPLQSLSDLVGRRGGDGKYAGVASDLQALFAKAPNRGTSLERHALARTLAACGETRVWNLLFDIIAQAGRFPPGAEKRGDLRNFVVGAEHRIWVHVAIDRLTGEVLDQQIEEVLE
jgi:hypothetical protein